MVTLLAWLMVPAGVLLVCAGVLDLSWWASADARRLTAVMAEIKQEYGVNWPALLRDGDAAVTLIVLGVAGMAYGLLAPMIRRGLRWARNWALGVGIAFFLVALMGIGADASQPSYLRDYYETLTWTTQTDRIAEVKAVLYPAWFQWFEDFAQGLGALAALAVVVGLIWATVAHPDHFVGRPRGKRARDGRQEDQWDAALARIRGSGGIDAVHDSRGGAGSSSARTPGRAGSPASGGAGAGGAEGSGPGSGSGAAAIDEDIHRLYRRPPKGDGTG